MEPSRSGFPESMPSDPWGPDPWKGQRRLTEREQQLRAERREFRDSLREWIATKWDGETPEHLKKALTTGDPKDHGLLIHEWRAFGRQKEIQTTDATFIKRLDFTFADQSAIYDSANKILLFYAIVQL